MHIHTFRSKMSKVRCTVFFNRDPFTHMYMYICMYINILIHIHICIYSKARCIAFFDKDLFTHMFNRVVTSNPSTK